MSVEESQASVCTDKQANGWAFALHLTLFAGCLLPWAGFVVPIVIWQMKKEGFPIIDLHGKIVANWIVSSTIYSAVFFILLIGLQGIAWLLTLLAVIAFGLFVIAFPVIGAIRALEGKTWRYPLCFDFFS